MGVSPINVARISQNLRAFNLLGSVRSSQLALFRTQNQLATGLRFSAPSDDPMRAADAIRLDRHMDVLDQVRRNLESTNAMLAEVESSMQTAVELVTQAHTLALQATGDTATPDERRAVRTEIEAIIEQLVSVGNRKHLGTALFSGHESDRLPFEWGDQGVIYHGDDGRLQTILDSDLSEETFTVPGMEFFNAVSAGVRGAVDLDPAVTPETRLSDLNGATGNGVRPGKILVSDGTDQALIDLSGADTVGDVLDKLNAEMPDTLVATLDARSIHIAPVDATPRDITVTDAGSGKAALDLGIYADNPVGSLAGADLDPRLTPRTRLADLKAGAGVDLSAGLTIRVGGDLARIGFEKTDTIEDVLNRINGSGIGVMARLSADGRTIEVRNRVSGADLRIEENGGIAATELGIRSLYEGTPLASLNYGEGVQTVEGDDFRITTANGTTIDIDLDDLDLDSATLQDVIDLINARGGGAVRASLTRSGNGITIEDLTFGGDALRIERRNLSPAIDDLGLNVASDNGRIEGEDRNPVRVEGPFGALLALREALDHDDTQAISAAGRELAAALEKMQEVQGRAAAKAAAMQDRAARIEDETVATRVLESDVRDVDMTEAIVRYQQVQIALQANLATASKIMNLSLLDYLR